MGRSIHKLTAKGVEKLCSPGWHGDGGGLWLRVTPSGAKRWIFAWERDKKRREMGLGSSEDTSLAKARERAQAARKLLADGVDPLDHRRAEEQAEAIRIAEEKRAQAGTPLFGPFATAYIDRQEGGWRNLKHRQQWRNTITTHAAVLLHKPLDEITTDDIVAVLEPIWLTRPETASRLRGRIENILDAAKAAKHISGPWENPARWRGTLNHLLPRRRRKSQVRHHPAMPYKELPDFFARLRSRPAPAARALEFTILHATRTSETLQMRWREVDLHEKVWIIPAERMKMGIEHRVPLTERGVEILKLQASSNGSAPDAFVFQGQKRNMPLSQMAMTMVLRRMKLGHFTVHGMRSSFRDYMGDMTNHPESAVEMALAHQVGDETERAYRRGDAFRKRQAIMEEWEQYLLSSLGSDTPPGPRPKRRKSLEKTPA